MILGFRPYEKLFCGRGLRKPGTPPAKDPAEKKCPKRVVCARFIGNGGGPQAGSGLPSVALLKIADRLRL